MFDLSAIIDIAVLILQSEGYNRGLSLRLVADRVRPRTIHSDPTRMPNRSGIRDLNIIHPPLRGDRVWIADDADRLNAVIRRVVEKRTV